MCTQKPLWAVMTIIVLGSAACFHRSRMHELFDSLHYLQAIQVRVFVLLHLLDKVDSYCIHPLQRILLLANGIII